MFFLENLLRHCKNANFSNEQGIIWIRKKVLFFLTFSFYIITPQLLYALGIENQSEKISRALVYADAGLWDKAFEAMGTKC